MAESRAGRPRSRSRSNESPALWKEAPLLYAEGCRDVRRGRDRRSRSLAVRAPPNRADHELGVMIGAIGRPLLHDRHGGGVRSPRAGRSDWRRELRPTVAGSWMVWVPLTARTIQDGDGIRA